MPLPARLLLKMAYVENLFRSRKILLPDVPPLKNEDLFEKQVHVFILTAIGVCCFAGAIALVLLIG